MSTFVLNRNYELQLPNSYVDVDREEMEYIEGGLIGLLDSVENWIWGVIGSVVGNILCSSQVRGWMVKAAVSSISWIKWAFIGARFAIKANPFAAGVIVGGSFVGIAWFVKSRFL